MQPTTAAQPALQTAYCAARRYSFHTMRHRTRFGAKHANCDMRCELCDQLVVFHWTLTYPDLLLCRECLECYPEALGTNG